MRVRPQCSFNAVLGPGRRQLFSGAATGRGLQLAAMSQPPPNKRSRPAVPVARRCDVCAKDFWSDHTFKCVACHRLLCPDCRKNLLCIDCSAHGPGALATSAGARRLFAAASKAPCEVCGSNKEVVGSELKCLQCLGVEIHSTCRTGGPSPSTREVEPAESLMHAEDDPHVAEIRRRIQDAKKGLTSRFACRKGSEFYIHTLVDVGGGSFCCKRCDWSNGLEHGWKCEQRRIIPL